MSLVARGHLRGNQVETAHALSSESALKLGVGVMVWGDKSSETPARTAGSLYPNGGMLPAGETDKGLYFPPQNKRRDGLRLGPSQRLPPTSVWCFRETVFLHWSPGSLPPSLPRSSLCYRRGSWGRHFCTSHRNDCSVTAGTGTSWYQEPRDAGACLMFWSSKMSVILWHPQRQNPRAQKLHKRVWATHVIRNANHVSVVESQATDHLGELS